MNDNELAPDTYSNSTSIPQAEQEPSNELTQEELHARYLEQQRRMSCPGCGESMELF